MAFAKVALCMAGVLVMFRMFCYVATEQYSKKGREDSQLGMMLERHIFKRITGPVMNYICLLECEADIRCQSFNYVISDESCELNDRTKEARPEDYVPNSDRFYFGRYRGRVPLGSIPELPAESCHEIKGSEGGQAVSGQYWFDSIVPEKVVLVDCDMETGDVDECSSSTPVCDVTATCENTIGSYRCLCPKAGFAEDGNGCSDIDECEEGSHDCDVNAYCSNTVGSYTCACKEKYYGDGKNCHDDRGLGPSVILGSLDYKNYTEKLLSYLEPVLLRANSSRFVRCWHAKTDGSAASTFHTNCDRQGPTVTIIKYGDFVFGGYTDVSWQGYSYSYASKAFIFSLYNAKGYNPVKLTQYQNQQNAMYSYTNYGPTFGGGHDIYISDNALSNQNSYTECGYTYSVPSGYSAGDYCNFFTGGRHFTPTNIEVFYEIDIDECAEGTHGCDVNAYCNNTVGSYTCTCKEKYFGDGKNCTRGLGASVILGNLDHKNYSEKLLSYLDPVLLSSDRSGFVRCWHAKTDGWASSTFHTNCDGMGPTVTIIKSGDYVFGGYTDVSWHGCSYSYASKAFLFSLYNAKGYNPVKLTQSQNQRNAIYSCSSYGPTFGAGNGHDMYISNDAINNQASHTKCGSTYSVPSGYSAGDCGFFTGALYFTPTDIEVFYEIGDLGTSAILGGLDHSKYLGKLLSYLDPVIPDAYRSEFVRCWHAKTDGSAASTFHNNCDGKGPTVTIIKYGDYIFGGYTDVSWHSSGGYTPASNAFIFSLYNAQGYNPVKLTQYQNQQHAMYKGSNYGPMFGSGQDIRIYDNALSNQNSYTRCGGTYSVPSGYSAGGCTFFTGVALHFTPTDIEVFYEIST
ncbi:uncharacterized protein LOC144631135 [Oculina patagonica]